jgi:hypothetical protein
MKIICVPIEQRTNEHPSVRARMFSKTNKIREFLQVSGNEWRQIRWQCICKANQSRATICLTELQKLPTIFPNLISICLDDLPQSLTALPAQQLCSPFALG